MRPKRDESEKNRTAQATGAAEEAPKARFWLRLCYFFCFGLVFLLGKRGEKCDDERREKKRRREGERESTLHVEGFRKNLKKSDDEDF